MCLEKTERANFLRYFCFFIDIGTNTLLQLFLHFVHQEDVVAFFSSDAVRNKCQELCDRTVLSQKQLSIVKHSCPDIFSFDISLLIALLSNLFTGKITPPKNGWQTNKPRRDDFSLAADIVRLRLMRNEVVGHSSRAKLSDGNFHELWGKLETLILRLYYFLKPDSTCDISKQIDCYKTMALDEQTERQYQEKLKTLQDACIEIVEIQDKVADLLQKSQEFAQFFRTKPKRFSLYIRLLLDGGRLVLTAYLQKELSTHNLSIQEVILKKRDVLERYSTGDLNEAVDKWDIHDLATAILVCFEDTVTPRIKKAITGIQDAFLGYAKLAFASLDADGFSDDLYLVNNLTRLSEDLGSDVEKKCEEIIETYTSKRKKQETETDTDDDFDLIKSHGVKMKSLEDIYKETLIQLKKVITEMEEKGIPFKKDYVLQLQLMTYGERKTLVEDILATVFTAVLRNEESTSGSEDISEATHLFLDQINNIPGVKVESVERHCILISITCSSSQGLLKLIEYVESTLFQEMLYKLSTELMAYFGEVLVVTGNFNFESLHDLDNFLSSCSASEHKPGGLTLNVACSSVEGINQVVRLMKADTTKHNVKQIAEHLSEQVQEDVSLQIDFPDLQDFFREVGDNGTNLSSSQFETAQPNLFSTNDDKDPTSPWKKSEEFGLQQEKFVKTTAKEAEICRTALGPITQNTNELVSIQEQENKFIVLNQGEAKKNIMLKQEEEEKGVILKQEEAKKDISTGHETIVKTVQDPEDSCSSQLKRGDLELRNTDKTLEFEIKPLDKMALKPSHKDELENKKYRNWIKAGLSLKYLKDGICVFADECAKLELNRIMQKLGLSSGSSCNQCNLTTLRPAHATKVYHCPIGQRHCSCLQNNTTSCPNNICGRIYDEIVDSHWTRSPNWKNTDITKWTTDPWEIAKCFINAQGYEGTRSASDTDVAGLLHLFINSTGFQGHMFCAINIFEKVKSWRSSLFHSPTMELEDQQLTDGIDDIIAILNDGKELKDNKCSKQAIHKLSKLQQENFVITTETVAEVCRTTIASITQITQELKSMQWKAKQDIVEAKKDIDLNQSEAEKSISLRKEKAVKKVQDATDACSSQLQREISELRDTVKTLELKINSLNERVNEVEQAVENLKIVKDNITEQLKKIDNIIALKRKLKERHRTRYIKTSQPPLTMTENDIEISQVYVPPNMTKVTEITSETREKKEHRVQIMDYSEIFLTDDKPNKRIYILGDVGAGKSAFCKMMISNWCLSGEEQNESAEEDVKTLEQFELLFYLPLCTFTDEDSMFEMIARYYGDICSKDELLNILQLIPEQCLVLADGIDEWKPINVGRRRAHETRGLPNTDEMDHVTVVMTSRPSAQGILNMDKFNYDVKVRLDGIRDVENFINKLYPKSHSKDIIRKLRNVPIKDLDLKKTPLLLQQIVWLQQQNIDIGKSLSEVYSKVVNFAFRWNQKHTEKAVVGDTLSAASTFTDLTFPDQIKNSYPEFISHSSVIFGMGKMAFEIMTHECQMSFGTIELKRNGVDENLRSQMLRTGLLTEEVRFDKCKEKTQFYFTYRSFLGYFAALYIASHGEQDKTSDSDSSTCQRSIFDIIMERCRSIQDVIRLENMLVIVCGLVPSLTFNVCMLMYESLKQSHIYEQKDTFKELSTMFELERLSEQCKELVYRCIGESKLSDLQCSLKLPYFAVEFGNTRRICYREAEVMQYVDPLTVRCCFCVEHCPVENLAVFQNLQILNIASDFEDPTDNELSSLAEYITQTVNLRHISLINKSGSVWRFFERKIPSSMIHTIDLSKHEQLELLVLQGVRHFRVKDINTVNLNHCIIRGTTCSLLSTHAENLNDLEITDIELKHDELSDWIKLINGSVLLKTIKISRVSCSDPLEGCNHELELLYHNQLQTLDVSNKFQGVRLHFKNISTLNLKQIDLDNAVISLSLTDTPNHCWRFSLDFISLKHDGFSDLTKFIARSVSMRELSMNSMKCLDHNNCSHKIDLSQFTQLEKLTVDWPFSCDKINTSNLTYCNTDNAELLHCLRDSIKLRILTLHRLSYSKDVHDCVLTLSKLENLFLSYMNIEGVVLVMVPEMKYLGKIELYDVDMSESGWLKFLESLLTLNQSVECKIFTMKPHFETVKNYISKNTEKFQILSDGIFFIFKSLK